MDQESVVIVKNPTGTAGVEIQEGFVGDEMHYNKMIKYIKEHDMKVAGCYDYVRTLIDTDNFIEYVILQIYCDNRDWPVITYPYGERGRRLCCPKRHKGMKDAGGGWFMIWTTDLACIMEKMQFRTIH